jgi:hypothetical protein
MHGTVELEEGCLITKSVKYTHQLAHMVNAVRSGEPKPVVRNSKRMLTHVLRLFSLQQDIID